MRLQAGCTMLLPRRSCWSLIRICQSAKLVASSLARQGVRVLGAASAAETLDLADCWKGRISLFLAPIEAEDLTASCRRAIPDLSVIHFSERYTALSLPPSQPRTRILPRPFSAGDLLDAVKELNQGPGADFHVPADADLTHRSAVIHDFAVLDTRPHSPSMAVQDTRA